MKGNVDAELVLHSAAIEYDNYDKAIVITSDGDFRCLFEYLKETRGVLKPGGRALFHHSNNIEDYRITFPPLHMEEIICQNNCLPI